MPHVLERGNGQYQDEDASLSQLVLRESTKPGVGAKVESAGGGTVFATIGNRCVVPQPFSFPPAPPQRLHLDWSSWIVIGAVLLLLVAFGLYFYAG